ncbi:peptidase M52 [Mycobacterium mantenii]|uniref:Peptidase M52 n=1 Tax=Mycobacterium mantenii TaxID=560555 RepID=A0A1X0G543_MYCNT|nr:hydrogenase maturation protease [Mycobacterium mantenii]MCV7242184.1 hydrogenase maturation protease [Mycobacterium mantenii]ORB09146.1 peptidase M52 [Mycobacterium mantenii]BBY37310.1 peptidase M52 [Mycobacterium mantenii]
MSGNVVVIGLGNSYRGDDGVGIAAAEALDDMALPGVRVVTGIAEPMGLIEAWSGAGLAVVIDAAANPAVPGRVRRCTACDVVDERSKLSSHGMNIGRTHSLGQALGRLPDALVVFTVEAADTGHGVGLSRPVAAAVPEVVDLVAAEINRARLLTKR